MNYGKNHKRERELKTLHRAIDIKSVNFKNIIENSNLLTG